MQKQHTNDNRHLLGIDLGTSCTAVMSNRGAKFKIRSVVGYPKDIIGVKLLNRTSVVGDEALEKRSYMRLHYPLADGVLKESSDKETQAAKELLRHVIAATHPQPDDRICGIVGVPARASITNKAQLLKITDEMMALSMVVSEPFMVAYGLNRLSNAIVIDIGAGTTDICAMKGTVPASEDQVTLLKAGDYIDSFLTNAIAEAYPEVQITPAIAQKIKEQFGFVGASQTPAIVQLRVGGKPRTYDVTREVGAACASLVPDMLANLESLIASFDPEDQEEAVHNIILAGGGSRITGLQSVISQHLQEYGEIKVARVEDPDYAGCAGALKLATELPAEYWSQVGDVIGS
ncbi:MAG: rod shape-determining protein [Magnetococcus sp. DMHC-6]